MIPLYTFARDISFCCCCLISNKINIAQDAPQLSILLTIIIIVSKVQFSSVAQLCPTLCGPMNCSMPGLPVHHQLLEFTQTHVHRVGDAIQPSHPVIPFSSCPPSFPASESFAMSQLFT